MSSLSSNEKINYQAENYFAKDRVTELKERIIWAGLPTTTYRLIISFSLFSLVFSFFVVLFILYRSEAQFFFTHVFFFRKIKDLETAILSQLTPTIEKKIKEIKKKDQQLSSFESNYDFFNYFSTLKRQNFIS